MTFSPDRRYDCVIARETFYRVADKDKFFTAIVKGCKPHAQISFTDYVLEENTRGHPAIVAWRNFEKGANPLTVAEMTAAWKKHGIAIRVTDDQTFMYHIEVVEGLKRLDAFLSSGIQPDESGRASLLRRVQTWSHRILALEHGLKFFRFYGTLS